MQLGHKAKTAEDAQDAYYQSVKYYVQAAQSYPQDEEAAITFYKVAVEGYWYLPKGAKLGDTAELISKINLLREDVMKIWEQARCTTKERWRKPEKEAEQYNYAQDVK